MSKNRVVFLNSIFPVLSETFLFAQYTKMLDEGMAMELVSSNRPKPEQVHPGMEPVQERVDYLCDASKSQILFALLYCLLRHPIGFIGALLRIFSLEEEPRTSVKHLCGAALVIKRYLSTSEPVRVHSHFTYGATSIALWIKRISGVPFSVTLHGSDLTFDDPADLETKLRESDLVICISQFNVDYVKQHFPSVEHTKLHVLGLGVSALPAPPKDYGFEQGKPLRILSVGRLSTQKAQEYLIRACAMLKQKGISFECQLVGEGPQRDLLEAEIATAGLEKEVVMLGAKFHNEVLAMYEDADVFVMSSVAEGMPIVLMEAMQAGVPVVSTAISGIPELLDHGRAGLLVPPSDEKAIADAIESIAVGNVDIEDIRQNAIDHIANHFDQEKNAVRFKELLETY